MRKRVTYIQRPDAPYERDQTVLKRDTLSVRDLDAVREERVTFSIEELPAKLSNVLERCHELHFRWATESVYDTLQPFSSRVSPGLSVYFTPVRGDIFTENLCPLIKEGFWGEIDCLVPEISFTTSPIRSDRFASTSTYQFYQSLPSLENLVTFIQNDICGRLDEGCRTQASSIRTADSLDIDYDSISHTLTITGYWSKPPNGGWTEEIPKHPDGTGRVEVGLLSTDKATEFEELKVGGLLAVVGEDERMKSTMFSFPSRHHPLPYDATYMVSFEPPTGLHPTMTISMPLASLQRPPADPEATCALHTYLTLPSFIFADKYQLSTTDSLFLQSHNLVALRAVSGETDLEAPDWVVHRWGSTWLLQLATPSSPVGGSDWNVTIPLHLRYLQPSETGYRSISVPWPVVFWACTAEEGTKMGVNPFDRVNLGWDGLFGPRTMFYQLHPSPVSGAKSPRLVEEIEVPTLRVQGHRGIFGARSVEVGTVAVILLGTMWILWKLGLVVRTHGFGGRREGTQKQGKEE